MDARAELAKRRVGEILRGKWRIDALLGVGGMAVVYAATHRNGKRVAVKMLHPEMSMDPDLRARFLREGYAANSIGHPGCVAVLDDEVSEDGAVFVVMELLEGETLDARAERSGGRLSPGEVVPLVDQLLDILAAAHAKGIIHRDLKPENLFLTHEGKLKVLDFGIARLRDGQNARLTATGVGMGTPAFMPPEQALAKWDEVDARSDLWAIGATMFTLLTGRLVHEAGSVAALLIAIATKPVAPIASILPGIPPALAAAIDRALAFDPAHRFQDARSMQAALRAASAVDSALLARPTAPVPAAAPVARGSTPEALPLKTQVMDHALADRNRGATLFNASAPVAPRSMRSAAPLAIGALVLLGGVAALLFTLGRTPETPAALDTASPSAATPALQGSTIAAVPSVQPQEPAPAPPPTQSAADQGPTAARPAPVATTAGSARTKATTASTATKKKSTPVDKLERFN
ncbi:serine/threonine-protein kinase [Polyangium aurulentum]|uniref:serine/threonine-protein kinase n=1 Tax=Polyangium aurulentum TaxID=2567896 RepID=UPI0010ADE7AB|nr:serine/threonine-protein kinase [Polyangium aurulentum]UQA57629.1 protein kinase [Polyangium aurulentum]